MQSAVAQTRGSILDFPSPQSSSDTQMSIALPDMVGAQSSEDATRSRAAKNNSSNFTPEEDVRLIQLLELHGKKWKRIAEMLSSEFPALSGYKTKDGKQCRERFEHHVSPELDKSPFTDHEYKVLMQLHEEINLEYGRNRWAELAKRFPRTADGKRSENDIKNIFSSAERNKTERDDPDMPNVRRLREYVHAFNKRTGKKSKPRKRNSKGGARSSRSKPSGVGKRTAAPRAKFVFPKSCARRDSDDSAAVPTPSGSEMDSADFTSIPDEEEGFPEADSLGELDHVFPAAIKSFKSADTVDQSSFLVNILGYAGPNPLPLPEDPCPQHEGSCDYDSVCMDELDVFKSLCQLYPSFSSPLDDLTLPYCNF